MDHVFFVNIFQHKTDIKPNISELFVCNFIIKFFTMSCFKTQEHTCFCKFGKTRKLYWFLCDV